MSGLYRRLRELDLSRLPLLRLWPKPRRRGHLAMIHVGRSGSTVVADLLGQHPLVRWDGEVYQRIFRVRERADGSLPPIAGIDPVRYLAGRAGRLGAAWYGFELKFFHLRLLGAQPGAFVDALDSELPGLHWIVLRRRNTLRKVVSSLAARASGTWHLRPGAKAPRQRVHVDPAAVFVDREHRPLLELLAGYERDFAALGRRLAGRRALWLSYEDDVTTDPRRAYGRICEFVGLPAHAARVRRARTNPQPLAELIGNFDEVREALRGSGFEWMLEE